MVTLVPRGGNGDASPLATVAELPLYGRVTGPAPQRKNKDANAPAARDMLAPRCIAAGAIIPCQCALARLVSLEVDWSLCEDHISVGSFRRTLE